MENQQLKKPKSEEIKVIRIMQQDIEGSCSLYSGLTQIKGISWPVSNAICKKIKIDKKKKVGSLTTEEIKKIEELIKNLEIPVYLKNRRKDFESGENEHLTGSDLDLKKEFDIKRLKKIKSYRGFRHMAKLPLRGQRTKSNFRKNRAKGAGIKKKKK